MASNEAEIARLAAADEADREHEADASCRISDGVHRPRQWPAEGGQQSAIGMQVTGIHPVAAAFPPMEGHAYEEMVESIRIHGLRQPIILTSDGLVIDGVNRLRACGEAGVEPVFETLPDSYDEEAIIRYIVDANLNRRDLSVGQRAMLAAEVIEPALRDAAKKRQRGGQGGRLLLANSPKANHAAPVHAREQAAKRSQVSDNSVAKAERILKHAPDLRAKIMANQISLHKADQQLRQRLEPDGASVPPPPFSLTLTNGGGSVTYRALSKDFSAPELNSFDWIIIGAKRSSHAIEQALVLGGQAQAVGCAVFHTSTALEEAIAKAYPAMAMLREVPGKKTRP